MNRKTLQIKKDFIPNVHVAIISTDLVNWESLNFVLGDVSFNPMDIGEKIIEKSKPGGTESGKALDGVYVVVDFGTQINSWYCGEFIKTMWLTEALKLLGY